MALGWEANTGGGGGGPLPVGGDLAGNTTSALVTGLQGRPVDNSLPSIGDVLAWDGAEYVLGAPADLALAGDLTGTTDAASVVALRGTSINPAAPIAGQVLRYNGAAYAPYTPTGEATYTATLWVDPAGDPLSDGLAPSRPTTLENALASVVANALIIVAGGSYAAGAPPYVVATSCTIQGAASPMTDGASATVRILSPLSITAPNVHVIGCRLASVTDSSAAAGTTSLIDCGVVGTISVASPAASQTLEVVRTDYADITVTGASGGSMVRVRDCRSGTSITSTATGAVSLTLNETAVAGALTLNNAGGSMSVTLTGSSIGSFVRTAGSVSGFVAVQSRIGTIASPGSVDLTGAGANTVAFIDTVLDRAGSTIPAGAEQLNTLVEHSSPSRALSFLPRDLVVATNLVPAPNNSPTPAAHLTVSPVLPTTGTYRFDVGIRLSGSSSGTEIAADFTVDGGSLGTGARVQTNVAGGVFPFGGQIVLPFAAGPHTFSLRFWQPSGPGTVTAEVSVIIITRIA